MPTFSWEHAKSLLGALLRGLKLCFERGQWLFLGKNVGFFNWWNASCDKRKNIQRSNKSLLCCNTLAMSLRFVFRGRGPVIPCSYPPTRHPHASLPLRPMPRHPAALSCLCSHHNKPGADGSLLRFALPGGDRQSLSANSLLGNQLTGLDSARCFYHLSSPFYTERSRRQQCQCGGISEVANRWWWVAAGRGPHHVSLWHSGTNGIRKRQLAVNSHPLSSVWYRDMCYCAVWWSRSVGIVPFIFFFFSFFFYPFFYPTDAYTWMKEPCAWEQPTGMPTRWDLSGFPQL